MLDITNVPHDDEKVWEMIGEGRVKGCFQIESHLGKTWCQKVKPQNMNELAALISIVRPGTLKSVVDGKSMTQRFVDRKHGEEDIAILHESITDILEETYGIIVFQEQAMKIAERMAKFDLKEADNLRKAIGKKKAGLMKEMREKFIQGCKENDVTEEKAVEIFDIIEKSNRYSFNKCISGKETLKKSTKGRHPFNPSIEEMYKIRNDIEYAKQTGHLSLYKKWKRLKNYGKGWSLCADGRIRPNIIKEIIYQGKREAITLHLSDGKTITVTENHKFPTSRGIVLAENILHGDKLYVCGEYEKTDFKPLTKFSNATIDNRLHTDTYNGQGFPSGEDNPAYTNGGYTSFQSFRDQTSDICCICQSTENIETDHINGDRTNNDWDNLQKLCSSCHKKKEYLNGRTKRGEKGYPSLMVEVVDITKNEPEDVYDVVMDGPNHNLAIDNGIITCNSHAVAYAIMAYWSAYLKYYYPKKFFKNWLRSADNKINPDLEKKQLIMAARGENITIKGPHISKPYENFSWCDEDEAIYFGICNIKNVGKIHLEKIKKLMCEIGDDPQWIDILFLVLPHINKRAVENMIKTGCFSGFGISRTQMLHEFVCIKNLTKNELKNIEGLIYESTNETESAAGAVGVIKEIIRRGVKKEGGVIATEARRTKICEILQRLESPGRSMADSPSIYAKLEEQLLGCSINHSELNACGDASHADTTIKEINDGKTTKSIVAAVITTVREHKTKNKDVMAFLTCEDSTGELENIVIFPDTYGQNMDIIYEEATVLLSGEIKDKSRNSFIVDSIFSI